MGAHSLSTHAHYSRVVYNLNIHNARSESQAHKKQAFHWYKTWASFQKNQT